MLSGSTEQESVIIIEDVKTNSELKSKEVPSDDDLENVSGGEKRSFYHVNELVKKCIVYKCPKCKNEYYIPKEPGSIEKFRYNYGVSGDDSNLYCPDCRSPKVVLEVLGVT
ncbi:MAG: hypothetical protein ACI4Q6_01175 [Huintestinicola sp.]